MEPIMGIVPSGDVPPTAELHPEGIVIRFFKHNPRLIRVDHRSLLDGLRDAGMDAAHNESVVLENGKEYVLDECVFKVSKRMVVFTLRQPEVGHGVIKLRRKDLIKLLGA